jgi:hypothetical protein
MDSDRKEKLIRLLDYWIEHNDEHGAEFSEWAQGIADPEDAGVRDELMQATEGMNEVSVRLRSALEKLKGGG